MPNHPSLLIFSKRGFIKRLRSNTWETQRRGGKGEVALACQSSAWQWRALPVQHGLDSVTSLPYALTCLECFFQGRLYHQILFQHHAGA